MSTKIDLEELALKARAADQDEWAWRWNENELAAVLEGIRDGQVVLASNRDCPASVSNAAHISANSPPVTLALIVRIRELDEALGAALARVPADAERDRLVDVLARGVVLPSV